MNTKTKIVTAFVLVSLGVAYSTIYMVLANNSIYSGNYTFGMTLFAIARFAPVLIFILLAGLFLGPVWGASVSTIILLISVIFGGFGIFSPIALWHFPLSTFAKYIAVSVSVGFFAKSEFSYPKIALSVFGALILGYILQILVSYITHREMLTIPDMFRAWMYLHGLGILLHTLLIPIIYLATKRVFPSNKLDI